MLPFVPALASVDKLFYLDADAVVLCDVALLWDSFAWPDGALMAATLEMAHSGQISMYQGMPAAFGGLGLNSGTLLMHLERMRGVGLVRIWREMAEIAAREATRACISGTSWGSRIKRTASPLAIRTC